MLVEFVGVLPLFILPGYFGLQFISSTNIRKFEQEWPTKGHFMDKLPLIFLYYLSNRRLWRCCEWRKNSEKSWSNLYQGNSDRCIQRGEMTVKLLLFEISIWRNSSSIGCLKWLQLHRVCIQDQSCNIFENDTMKISVKEAKLTGLWARSLQQFNKFWFQNLPSGPKNFRAYRETKSCRCFELMTGSR